MGHPNSPSQDLEILNRIARALNRSATLNDALSAALEQVAYLLNLETGWIFLVDQTSGETYLAAAQNLPPGLENNPEEMEGTCYCLDTFRDGDMAGAANINTITCSRLKWMRDRSSAGLRFHASIPLYAHDKQMGILNVASQDWRELSDEELALLHTIGDMVGIAVERAQLFDQSLEIGVIEERNRLAREIHDTLAQELVGVTLQLETASALLETGTNSENVRSLVEMALTSVQNSLDDVQRSVLDLRAAPLEGKTLPSAMAELVEQFRLENKQSIDFSILGGQQPLSSRIEIGLYRIAQEGLRNCFNHAGATQISLHLQLSPETAILILEDDGRGFDPIDVSDQSHGLVGMNERAQLLNGHLKIKTTPGQGTIIKVVVPIK